MISVKLRTVDLATRERTRFVELFGSVFEDAPWVAEQAFDVGPFHDVETLHEAMVEVMRRAPGEQQLALIRAHPDLAGRAAIRGELSAASTAEQASAGLDQCTPIEFNRFRELNDKYKEKFRFPFIIAVKGRPRTEILAIFEQRLHNSPAAEFDEALNQIAQIARLRLHDLIRP